MWDDINHQLGSAGAARLRKQMPPTAAIPATPQAMGDRNGLLVCFVLGHDQKYHRVEELTLLYCTPKQMIVRPACIVCIVILYGGVMWCVLYNDLVGFGQPTFWLFDLVMLTEWWASWGMKRKQVCWISHAGHWWLAMPLLRSDVANKSWPVWYDRLTSPFLCLCLWYGLSCQDSATFEEPRTQGQVNKSDHSATMVCWKTAQRQVRNTSGWCSGESWDSGLGRSLPIPRGWYICKSTNLQWVRVQIIPPNLKLSMHIPKDLQIWSNLTVSFIMSCAYQSKLLGKTKAMMPFASDEVDG